MTEGGLGMEEHGKGRGDGEMGRGGKVNESEGEREGKGVDPTKFGRKSTPLFTDDRCRMT